MALLEQLIDIVCAKRCRLMLPEHGCARTERSRQTPYAGYVHGELVGDPRHNRAAGEAGVNLTGFEVIDPAADPRIDELAATFHARRGSTGESTRAMHQPMFYAASQLRDGDTDAALRAPYWRRPG